jgi:Ca2+-binding EF-hand superfamily protein
MGLSDLISEEIRILRRLEILKEELSMRYDYSNYSAFRAIDKYNDGFLNVDNIRQFYRNFYSYPSERELLSLVRRIDTDGDAKISFSEFSEFMRSNS